MASRYEIGEQTFVAPKGSNRRKAICKICREPIGSEPYIMALREGPSTQPIDEKTDVARIHEVCLQDS
jgi:hypothetical protein